MPTPRRLSIELQSDQGTPAGLLRAEDGTEFPFSGWLGLASALDSALSTQPAQGATAEDQTTLPGEPQT